MSSELMVGAYSDVFDEDFQRKILSLAARDRTFIPEYRSVLDPRYFTASLHQVLARALLAYYDEEKQLPGPELLRTLAQQQTDKKLRKAIVNLVKELWEVPLDDARGVRRLAIQFGQESAIVMAVIDCGSFIESREKHKVLPHIKAALQVGESIDDIGLDWKEGLESRIQKNLRGESPRVTIPTGIQHLDFAMGGGLGRGELGVGLGRVKIGKTTFLACIGYGGLIEPEGYCVVHYTLEISEVLTAMKYDSRLLGRKAHLRDDDPEAWAKLMRQRVKRDIPGRLFIREYPEDTMRVSDIETHLELLRSRGIYPSVVLVDYATLLLPERHLRDRRDLEIDSVFRGLRALAREYNCAVWTAAQGTTGSFEKETLDLTDFRDSRGIPGIADYVIGINATDDEEATGRMRLVGLVMRNNDRGVTVECSVNRYAAMITSNGLTDLAGVPIEVPVSGQPSKKGYTPGEVAAEQPPREVPAKKANRDKHGKPKRRIG